MRRAMRVCRCTRRCPAHPGNSCPTLVPSGLCGNCAPGHEQRRGTRQARGYDAEHDRLRKQWAPKVAAGAVRCARGDHLIPADAPWALDHTDDRTGYLGPSCATCNNRAGGRAAHRT